MFVYCKSLFFDYLCLKFARTSWCEFKGTREGGGRSQAWSRSNPIGGGWLKMVWSHAQILTFLSFSLRFWTSKCKRVEIAMNLEVLWFVALSHISNQICPSSNFQPSLSVCLPVWLIGATKTQPIFRFQVFNCKFRLQWMQTKSETECPHQNEWDLCHELLFQSKLLECNWWVWNWGGEGFGSIFRNLPALPNPQYAGLPLIRHPANPSGGLFAVVGDEIRSAHYWRPVYQSRSPPMITLYEVLKDKI